MAHDREVAGIRCSEVLALLGDYVDDDLGVEDRARIDAHLTACDWCERFGGAYGSVVSGLRALLAPTGNIPSGARQRLSERLRVPAEQDETR